MEGNRGNRSNWGNSEGGAVEFARAAELVVRVVRDIDGAGAPEGCALLTDLLCAAWPTERAQCQ